MGALLGCGGTAVPPTPPPAPTVPPAPETTYDGTILAFGDSLTEGFGVATEEAYPAQLERKLQADGYNYRVINGGISGETSTAALSRLDWMLGSNPDIVIIETGANDALRGVDIGLTSRNFDEIIRKLTENDVIVVIGGLQIIQNLGQEYTDAFAAIYPEVAERYDSILIPFMLEGVATDPELNQDDFIHPTAEGYTVMVDHIYPFVIEAIEASEER